ncbi:MAG: alpha/beta fold hydrolase, partial [Candidatus Eremiobacteraeota bacterium]|nr:alpha/beta fold hydrolase [Candidatus Eremiobacteraeota bacterium]
MLASQHSVDNRPVVFCLHYLGGSAREWSHVAAAATAFRCVALDLPGFGDAVGVPGYTVAEMSAYVAERVRDFGPQRWLLAGHSMGAKVATVLARAIEHGAVVLPGFEGLVLLAGSPPNPEPMDEKQRENMIGWFAGDADANRANAETYVSSNAASLDAASFALAVDDATRMERAAWLAWLESGSREDWSERVGRLKTPALVLAGELDEQLGPDAQRESMVPHFEHARTVTLAGAKHLLPLERAREVARAMDEHVLAAGYRALVASGRVGAKTRDALEARERPDDPAYAPRAMDVAALATLRAMTARIVPQDDA